MGSCGAGSATSRGWAVACFYGLKQLKSIGSVGLVGVLRLRAARFAQDDELKKAQDHEMKKGQDDELKKGQEVVSWGKAVSLPCSA